MDAEEGVPPTAGAAQGTVPEQEAPWATLTLGQPIPGATDGESDTVEFKDTHSSSQQEFLKNIDEHVLKVVTGFLNCQQGGTLFFGVDDATRKVVGVPFPQGDAGTRAWDRWQQAASHALRCCPEAGHGANAGNTTFKIFASRDVLGPSMVKIARVPVVPGNPAEYVAGRGPIEGHDLFVVTVTAEPAVRWPAALVGDCTTWLVKEVKKTRICAPAPAGCGLCKFLGEGYSVNQKMKPEGLSRCKDCVAGSQKPVVHALKASEGGNKKKNYGPTRECYECERTKPFRDEYSKNQWVNHPETSRCKFCIDKQQAGGGKKGNDAAWKEQRKRDKLSGLVGGEIGTGTAGDPQLLQPVVVGQTVEAKYTEGSKTWKRAKVVALQPKTDCFVLHFEGYADHVGGIPRKRIRCIAGGGASVAPSLAPIAPSDGTVYHFYRRLHACTVVQEKDMSLERARQVCGFPQGPEPEPEPEPE